MATVEIEVKKKEPYKEQAEVQGKIVSASGESVDASALELKTVRAISLTTTKLHYYASGSVANPGSLNNNVTIRITYTGTSGPSTEATGSHSMFFVAVGE